jgi:hypothetical protein
MAPTQAQPGPVQQPCQFVVEVVFSIAKVDKPRPCNFYGIYFSGISIEFVNEFFGNLARIIPQRFGEHHRYVCCSVTVRRVAGGFNQNVGDIAFGQPHIHKRFFDDRLQVLFHEKMILCLELKRSKIRFSKQNNLKESVHSRTTQCCFILRRQTWQQR